MRKLGHIQRKMLLLLAAGIGLSGTYSPGKSLRIIKGVAEEWKKIDRQKLSRAIQALYQSQLIEQKQNSDGSMTFILNKAGEREVLRYKLNEISIPKQTWDKKWRLVLFDIPEINKKLRDAFRWHLKQLGFYEFQKSAFIHPHECRKEIDFIIEFYQARKHIRYLTVENVDNELHLRNHFRI